jgi:dTMP kinase
VSTEGCFITLEGVEGAGKSSAIAILEDWISSRGIALLTTREPGGTRLGEAVRELLLSHRHTGMCVEAELLLIFAARAEHLQQRIEPALRAGDWVLCDRFTDATYAYQGGGRGLARARLEVLEHWVQGARRPDHTILLDVPVDLGLARAGKRSSPDRFERETAAFFERVRQAYLSIARREPQRVHVVDASRPREAVNANLIQIMERIFQWMR